MKTMRIVRVCIPHTQRDFFDYLAPDGVEPCIGARVWVPFRRQRRLGVVLGVMDTASTRQGLKTIETVLDKTPLMCVNILALCEWMARYYHASLSEVLSLALPKKYRLGADKADFSSPHYQLALSLEEGHHRVPRRALRQHALLDFLAQTKQPLAQKNIIQAGFTRQVLQALVDAGLVRVEWQEENPWLSLGPPQEALPLNAEQAEAVNNMAAHLQSYRCFLLQGVTGSGKTEVYLEMISQVLALGRQVLVLVPEIGLTPQLLQRFRARMTVPMAVIHSDLSDVERQQTWQAARDGALRLIIGTRAALFTPLSDLGLIVVDEEHDASLKQMDGVRYSARDAALMRASFQHIPIILGSATPSLESLHNVAMGKYTRLILSKKALTQEALRYQIIDVRQQNLQHGLTEESLRHIAEHLQRDNQVLVFINRRGYAPVLLCHLCGWMADCRACDAHLTLHRQRGHLICHHCGLTQQEPSFCQKCHGKELIAVGVGTQRVHAFLQEQFPQTALLRIDRDSVRKKQDWEKHLAKISSGEAKLLVGTQMLAKGHHFPRLSLVLVLDADYGFYNQDFRALERLGQLLTQVAGRAGRAQFSGHVLIQTHLPQHPLLNLLVQEGYNAFAGALLLERRAARLPPYCYLALIRAQSKSVSRLEQFLFSAKKVLSVPTLEVLGPAPSPLSRKAGYHQMQLLLKSPSRQKRSQALNELSAHVVDHKLNQGLRWTVDVDPVDLA
jgi:primosomal protein N' (replication factor Y)